MSKSWSWLLVVTVGLALTACAENRAKSKPPAAGADAGAAKKGNTGGGGNNPNPVIQDNVTDRAKVILAAELGELKLTINSDITSMLASKDADGKDVAGKILAGGELITAEDATKKATDSPTKTLDSCSLSVKVQDADKANDAIASGKDYQIKLAVTPVAASADLKTPASVTVAIQEKGETFTLGCVINGKDKASLADFDAIAKKVLTLAAPAAPATK